VQQVRAALAAHLGPKKYRRFLHKAVVLAPGPGRLARPPEWDEFVRLNPGCEIPEAEWPKVFALCIVHGCELVEMVVRGAANDRAFARDVRFLKARGTQFPYAHGEDTGEELERTIWWCPECQRAREEWMATRTEHI
jgi:hypothetical protein